MKKVLMFSHEFPPALGGAGSVAKRNVLKLISSGAEVTVLTKKGADDIPGITFYKLNVLSKFWFVSYFLFFIFRIRWLREFDEIILNDPAAIYIAGLCMPKDVLNKSMAYIHGSEIENIYEKNCFVKRLQFFSFFFSKGIKNSRKIIFPSKWLQNKFVNRAGLGDLFLNSTVSYAGIDRSIFNTVDSDIRSRLLIPDSAKVILSVSRVIAMKGYPEMYQLFKDLHQSDNSFHWIVVGDGVYLDELNSKIQNDGLSDYIHTIGPLPQIELCKYYSASDVFVLLSKFEEAYGLVYLEAAASGTPCIALNKGGTGEAILDGKTGFLVNNVGECYKILVSSAFQSLKSEDMKCFVDSICENYILSLDDFEMKQ